VVGEDAVDDTLGGAVAGRGGGFAGGEDVDGWAGGAFGEIEGGGEGEEGEGEEG